MQSKIKIIYFGTPEFAVASLKELLNNHFDVVAVVTAPDKPAGRGMNLQMSAIQSFAIENNLPVLQPTKLKDDIFLNDLKLYNADLFIVVAFRMLPELVWNMPPLGTINLHASLLPQYRGAAPINWAIINGETKTGVTTFKLKHQIDTGNILLQQEVDILPTDDAGILHDRLMLVGAKILVETVKQIAENNIKEIPQTQSENVKHAPKIYTATCEIDWSKKGYELHQLIRGLNPYPSAFTYLNTKKLKIFKSSYEKVGHDFSVGKIMTDNKSFLKFTCTDGYVLIHELQLEGKKKMSVEDFLRGNKIL